MSNKLSPGDRVSVDAGLGITKTGNVQRITESTVFVKHYNGSVVGYRTQHVTKMLSEEVSAKPRGVGLKSEFDAFMQVMEKTLTPAELKKREEVAKAMERENPDMPMDKKMAIATATAKKVAEGAELAEGTLVTKDGQTALRPGTLRTHTIVKSYKHDSGETAHVVAQPNGFHGVIVTNKGKTAIVGSTHGNHDEKTAHKIAQHYADSKTVGMKAAWYHGSDESIHSIKEEAKPHTVPKTAKEKSLAAIAEPKDKITHADVMVGRGVKKEEIEQADEAASWNPIKHIPKEKQNDAIKTAAKDVKRGSYADRAALLRAGGVKQEGVMDTLKKVGSKVLDTLGHGDDEQMRKDLQKKMGIPQTGKPGMAAQKEEISTAQMGHAGKTTIKHIKNPTVTQRMAAHDVKPGVAGYRDRIALLKAAQAQGNLKEEDVHYCAKHVFSERFGEGMVVEGQHAEPNEQGLIEWYDVDFGGTVRRVMTEKVKVMHAEYHMNHKKKMKEEDEIEVEDEDDKEEMKEMSSKEKMKRGLYNEAETGNLPGYRTHILNKDVRHPEHGIISNGTVLRHTGGSNFEVRAGRAKGKIVNIPKEHVNKLDEEVDLDEAMISYSDFQSKIDSHRKAGNQIKDDKYDKKKASYTVVDQEGTAKKITHTDAGVSQQHLGSMKRDDSDDKSAETKPKETRGRGRPAGSKSGARN